MSHAPSIRTPIPVHPPGFKPKRFQPLRKIDHATNSYNNSPVSMQPSRLPDNTIKILESKASRILKEKAWWPATTIKAAARLTDPSSEPKRGSLTHQDQDDIVDKVVGTKRQGSVNIRGRFGERHQVLAMHNRCSEPDPTTPVH